MVVKDTDFFEIYLHAVNADNKTEKRGFFHIEFTHFSFNIKADFLEFLKYHLYTLSMFLNVIGNDHDFVKVDYAE